MRIPFDRTHMHMSGLNLLHEQKAVGYLVFKVRLTRVSS